MLDMIKAFERVPHQWLVRQGLRYRYPLTVLRLCIAAYRLARCITVHGVCSVLLFATRGITAGAVHATVELRLWLIEWLDQTVSFYPINLTVYVDDTSFDATGSEDMVCDMVCGAVQHFTDCLVDVGMAFSDTRNVILASSDWLAYRIMRRLPRLRLRVVRNAKSLGGAISSGRGRHAKVAATRLAAFPRPQAAVPEAPPLGWRSPLRGRPSIGWDGLTGVRPGEHWRVILDAARAAGGGSRGLGPRRQRRPRAYLITR